MRLDERGFGLGLLGLVIAVLVMAFIYFQVMNLYMGKSSRSQEQMNNALGDVNVSSPAGSSENYDGLLSSVKSRLNASTQKELDRSKDLVAY